MIKGKKQGNNGEPKLHKHNTPPKPLPPADPSSSLGTVNNINNDIKQRGHSTTNSSGTKHNKPVDAIDVDIALEQR